MNRSPMPPRTRPLVATTELRRTTGLSRGTGLERAAWSRPVPLVKNAATRKDAGFSRAVKLGVRKRAGGGFIEDALCESCGVWLGRYGGEVQHRAARGVGGCADEVIEGYANAALLCGHGAAPIRSGCHGECEDRKARMGMDAAGFWIKHGTTAEFDPRNVPVLLRSPHGSGIKVWLAADGKGPDGTGYLFEAPEGLAA